MIWIYFFNIFCIMIKRRYYLDYFFRNSLVLILYFLRKRLKNLCGLLYSKFFFVHKLILEIASLMTTFKGIESLFVSRNWLLEFLIWSLFWSYNVWLIIKSFLDQIKLFIFLSQLVIIRATVTKSMATFMWKMIGLFFLILLRIILFLNLIYL